MRKILLILLAIAVPVILLAASLYSARANLQGRMINMLAAYGFNQAQIARVDYRDGYVVYSGITLDPDGFSTISDIQIPTGYVDFLLQKSPRIVSVNDLELTGAFDSHDGLSISGWKQGPLPHPLADVLALNDGRLDLDTSAGGLRFEARGEIAKGENGVATLKAAVWARQHQLEGETIWNGRIFPDGRWIYEIEIQQGSLHLDRVQGSRMSGWIVADKSTNIIPVISGQIDAGKLTVGEVDLMNARLTLSGPLNLYKMIGAGMIGDYENMAFTLEISGKPEGPHVYATIETASLDDLIAFLGDLQKSDTAAGNLTSLLLTRGNLRRLENELKKLQYDVLELQVYGSLYDLVGKVIARRYKDGVTQNNVISLDPGADGNNG